MKNFYPRLFTLFQHMEPKEGEKTVKFQKTAFPDKGSAAPFSSACIKCVKPDFSAAAETGQNNSQAVGCLWQNCPWGARAVPVWYKNRLLSNREIPLRQKGRGGIKFLQGRHYPMRAVLVFSKPLVRQSAACCARQAFIFVRSPSDNHPALTRR